MELCLTSTVEVEEAARLFDFSGWHQAAQLVLLSEPGAPAPTIDDRLVARLACDKDWSLLGSLPAADRIMGAATAGVDGALMGIITLGGTAEAALSDTLTARLDAHGLPWQRPQRRRDGRRATPAQWPTAHRPSGPHAAGGSYNPSMALPPEVCIRGAGIVGRTLALLLARERVRVALVAPPAAQGARDIRAYALNAASRQLLESLRAWPDAAHATPRARNARARRRRRPRAVQRRAPEDRRAGLDRRRARARTERDR